MKRTHFRIAAVLLALSPSAAAVSGEEMRDEVIKIVSDGDWSTHTCRRVEGLGKGTVSPEDCASRVNAANAECIKIAKGKFAQVTSENDARLLVEILMTCPVAKVLDIDYVIDGENIHIQWSEIGR